MSTRDHLATSIQETVTLSEAKAIIQAVAMEQSVLLLSPPGVGKSDLVRLAAEEAGLPCRSLLGTQIAPEDVSGIPRIVGERSVFCPPRILLPEEPEPFCLFLDELPATTPDIQKAFYSLLLERRLGEHPLPPGTWVVAAGNRVQDRALVRSLSSALVNRVTIIHVRVDHREWIRWAQSHGVRREIISFINFLPDALMRPVPGEPVPFSTPRSWASLSRMITLTEQRGLISSRVLRALAFGSVSAEDAAIFCAMHEEALEELLPIEAYLRDPDRLPEQDTARWFLICRIRQAVQTGELPALSPAEVQAFLKALPEEHRFALLVDLVEEWGVLGADDVMLSTLLEVTGLS